MCGKSSSWYGLSPESTIAAMPDIEPGEDEAPEQAQEEVYEAEDEPADEPEGDEAAPEPWDEEEAARKDAAIEDEVISMLIGVPSTRESRLEQFGAEMQGEVVRLDSLLDGVVETADKVARRIVPNIEILASGLGPVPPEIRSEVAEVARLVIEKFEPIVDRLVTLRASFRTSIDRLESAAYALE